MYNVKICFVILIALPVMLNGQRTFLDSPENIQLLRNFKEWVMHTFGKTSLPNNPIFREAQRRHSVQNIIPAGTAFPCNVSAGRSTTAPTSVHRLRPGDIDIVGALGDSLTAGFGIFATSFLNAFVENRGSSAYGGGEFTWRERLTIPNILKEYNPNLYGYASEDSFSHQASSHFNVAENMAMSKDLPFMANNLVQRMKQDRRVNIGEHWKLITILIGANDFCSEICWAQPPSKALDYHKSDLIETLRILRDNLPRTIVSMVSVPNLRQLFNVKDKFWYCQSFVRVGCPCLLLPRYQHQQAEFDDVMSKWQVLDQEIAAYPEFQTDDFSVVIQTFGLHPAFRTPLAADGTRDFRFVSVDCFHFSQLANARLALNAWANMFQPSADKTVLDYEAPFPCPTEERPYFATPGNS